MAQYSLLLTSVFQIEATARPGVKPEQLEKAIDAELALLREKGPTEAEVEQARNRMLSANIRGLETTDGVADRLNRYNHYLGTPDYLQQDMARYARLTPESLRAAASNLLPPARTGRDLCVPGEKVINDVPRGKPPANSPVPQKTARRLARHAAGRRDRGDRCSCRCPAQFELANGLTVMLFEQHDLPLVSANLVVLAGSDRNPAGPTWSGHRSPRTCWTRARRHAAICRSRRSWPPWAPRSARVHHGLFKRLAAHIEDHGGRCLGHAGRHRAEPGVCARRDRASAASRQTQLLQQSDNPDGLARSALVRGAVRQAAPLRLHRAGDGRSRTPPSRATSW